MNSKKFELSKREVESMEKLVLNILDYEYDSYVLWCDGGNPKDHVYYHADLLAGKLLEWKGEKDCCESQAKGIREREKFFTDSSYDQKVF